MTAVVILAAGAVLWTAAVALATVFLLWPELPAVDTGAAPVVSAPVSTAVPPQRGRHRRYPKT